MLKSIINLDFYQAFRYNQLLFISLFLFIIYVIVNVFAYIKKKAIYIPSSKLLIIIVIVVLLFMLLRNIPYFNYLIPTKV